MRVKAGIAATVLVGMGSLVPSAAATATVKVRDNYFTPHFRVLVTGDSVTWTVEGLEGHTVTSFPGASKEFDSSPETTDSCEPEVDPGGGGILPTGPPGRPAPSDCLYQGATFSQSFQQAATIDYYCKVHGTTRARPKPGANAVSQPCGMCGRILVKVPSSARPANQHGSGPPTATPGGAGSRATPTDTSETDDDPTEIDGSPIAGPAPDDSGSSGAQTLAATLAIAVLMGLGYLVWRRYFQPE